MARGPALLVVTLLSVTIGMVLVFGTVLVLHEYVTPMPRIRALVNINGEANLPAWWNSALLMTIGFGALAARAFETERPARRAWLTVAVAALLLSLDEIAGLHERLGAPVREAGIEVPTFAWLVPGVFIGAALATVLVVLGRGLPLPTRHWLLLALVCYLVGALGVEAINGTLRSADRLIYYWIGTTVEETVEMIACVVAVGAIARVVADQWARWVSERRSDHPGRLEVVGHGAASGADGADADAHPVRRIDEAGRTQDQLPTS